MPIVYYSVPSTVTLVPFVCNYAYCDQIQRLGKEAAEAAGLRERGRELAREVKRLTLEADARQGRLEEARERGARAEEALRASQVCFGCSFSYFCYSVGPPSKCAACVSTPTTHDHFPKKGKKK